MIPYLVSTSLLFGCSAFIGNGFSPVFSVMKETGRSRLPWHGLALFFLVKLVFDAATGVLGWTWVQYPAWALCYWLAKHSAVASSTLFYLLSNTICFFQMNGTSPGAPALYSPDFAGYLACLTAGLPFYGRSLAATIVACLAFHGLHAAAPVRYERWIRAATARGLRPAARRHDPAVIRTIGIRV